AHAAKLDSCHHKTRGVPQTLTTPLTFPKGSIRGHIAHAPQRRQSRTIRQKQKVFSYVFLSTSLTAKHLYHEVVFNRKVF
ncbi:MAG TPA: hypothetical protein VH619_06360, partial [Verrucomicrobiae bacterium]|nr:hypothetical protein [Verrucomicrobiae bacterium]